MWRREVEAANEAFYGAFESLDLDRMDDVWAHHDGVRCVHPGWGMLVGWARVRRSWEMIFHNTTRMRFSIDDVSVRGHDEIAWVVLTENLVSEAGGQRTQGPILATNVFERVDGLWLLVHHHASGVMRAPDPGPSSTVH